MNERQRDLFLWLWSRRRKPGRANIALRGAGIGALGGVLFAILLSPGAPPNIPAYDTGGQLFGALFNNLRLLAVSVPAFGFIGWLGADRVFVAQETMYQSMLSSGAQAPTEKPVMQPGDRGPALAVGIAAALIATFIIVLFVMYG